MTAHNQMSRRAFKRKQKIAAAKARQSERSRISEWETAHENLLAELLSSDSGDAKENPQENNEDGEASH